MGSLFWFVACFICFLLTLFSLSIGHTIEAVVLFCLYFLCFMMMHLDER